MATLLIRTLALRKLGLMLWLLPRAFPMTMLTRAQQRYVQPFNVWNDSSNDTLFSRTLPRTLFCTPTRPKSGISQQIHLAFNPSLTYSPIPNAYPTPRPPLLASPTSDHLSCKRYHHIDLCRVSSLLSHRSKTNTARSSAKFLASGKPANYVPITPCAVDFSRSH